MPIYNPIISNNESTYPLITSLSARSMQSWSPIENPQSTIICDSSGVSHPNPTSMITIFNQISHNMLLRNAPVFMPSQALRPNENLIPEQAREIYIEWLRRSCSAQQIQLLQTDESYSEREAMIVLTLLAGRSESETHQVLVLTRDKATGSALLGLKPIYLQSGKTLDVMYLNMYGTLVPFEDRSAGQKRPEASGNFCHSSVAPSDRSAFDNRQYEGNAYRRPTATF